MDAGNYHYNQSGLVEALRAAGVQAGDILFSHVGLAWLGYPQEGRSAEVASQVLLKAVQSVLGPTGSWLVPTYTYSFCSGNPYEPASTPSTVGPFSNYFLQQAGVLRSEDPIFSVAGLGPAAPDLLGHLPRDCFGPDSVYGRLLRCQAKICNFGVGFRYATLIHHVEQEVGVPYRFHKSFQGCVVEAGRQRMESWNYYVRFLVDNSVPDLSRLEERALQSGSLNIAPLGLSNVTCIGTHQFAELARESLAADPWCLVKGPPFEPAAD